MSLTNIDNSPHHSASATSKPNIKYGPAIGTRTNGMTAVTPNFLKHRKPDFKKYKSYDETKGKTLGLVYSPHNPIAAETLDRLELARCLRILFGSQLSTALVAVFNNLNPSIEYGRRETKPKFNTWVNLPGEIKPAMYGAAALENGIPITDALTIHIPDMLVDLEYQKGLLNPMKKKRVGPAKIIGSNLISKTLSKIYRERGLLAEFNYIYVMEAKPLFEDNEITGKFDKSLGRSNLVSFHATVALNIPDSIRLQVLKAIASWANMDVKSLTVRNSNSPAYLQKINNDRSFSKGADNTGRRGLLGLIDYACKGLRCNYSYSLDYQENNSFPLPMNKYSGASSNIRSSARNTYEFLRYANKAKPSSLRKDTLIVEIGINEQLTRQAELDAKNFIERFSGGEYNFGIYLFLLAWDVEFMIRLLEHQIALAS